MRGLKKSASEKKGLVLEDGGTQYQSSQNQKLSSNKGKKQIEKNLSFQEGQLDQQEKKTKRRQEQEEDKQEQPLALLAQNSLCITLQKGPQKHIMPQKGVPLLDKKSKGEGQVIPESNCKISSSIQSSLSDDQQNNTDGSSSSSRNSNSPQHKQRNQKNSSTRNTKSNGAESKKSSKTQGRWTKEEHEKFEEGLQLFGRNWKRVEEHIGTRTGAQIRSHAQKFYNRLEKEQQTSGNTDKSKELFGIMTNPAVHSTFSQKSLNGTRISSNNNSLTSESKKQSISAFQQVKDDQIDPNYQEDDLNSLNNISYNQQVSNHTNILHHQNKNNSNMMPQLNINTDQIQGHTNISIGGNGLYSEPIRKTSDDFDVAKLLMNQTSSLPQLFIQQQQQMSSAAWNKIYEYTLMNRDESDESGDNSDGNQLRQFYEQAINNPIYNQNQQPFLTSRPPKSQTPQNSFIQGILPTPATPPTSLQNHNRYMLEDRESEDIIERYLKNAESANMNDNSYFMERNLGDMGDPKLFEICALGQTEQSSNSLNYRSEMYVPNQFQKNSRSRFGSFKLHDEENESSNLKYQNLRKISIDDYEFKKKLKLNDGNSLIQSTNGTQKISQDVVI